MAGHGGSRQTIFFISRAGADSEIAAEIGGILKAAGYDVILQQWDFLNRSFIQKMHDALRVADHVIALLSRDYMKSDHCAAEWQNAIASDPLNKQGRLIVLRAAECEPEGLLSSLAYWDLVPLRGDDGKLRQAVLTAARANPQRADFEAPPFFHRANLWMPPAEKIVHRKVEPVAGFTGRGAELETLEATLWTKGGAPALTNSGSTAAVRGLGGVGKTTLAREYAWRNQRSYGGIWWLEAEKRHGRLDELITGLIELGERLIPGIQHMPDREKAARAVLDYIEDGRFEQPWLLVYDNVENPRDLDGWTPRAGAHILITTRWADWDSQVTELPVDVFKPEVALDFLMADTLGTGLDTANMRAAAGRLAADLGYLPLALSHARAYCKKTKSFSEYREMLPDMIKLAPKDAAHPEVFATFNLAIKKASESAPEVEKLMGIAAFMAPDHIPLSVIGPDVISKRERYVAIAALAELSLITLDAGENESGDGGDTRTISMHRLVQAVARGRLTLDRRGEALNRLVKALESAFPEDPVRLFPHIVEVLQVLGQEEHRDFEASDAADRLARLIIIALRTIGSKQKGSKVPAEYLEAFLSYFYEVDPLIGALDVLMREHWGVWPRLQERLLAADNYVLRYAMASSLANACTGDAPFAGVEEAAALTDPSKTLNEFELGGYALALIYARNPDLIDSANLQKLAARREYPGRSILGDFLLNLAFRKDIDCSRNPRAMVQSERFWKPIWDFIKLDVWAIEAAEAFMATPRRLPPGAAPEVKATFKSFEEIERNIAKTLQQADLGEELRGLLGEKKYFLLGQHTDRIQAAQQELDTKSHTELTGLMRIFFAHPIWAVAEAAATVLSGLVENDRDRLNIIAELSKDENWRVQFGANEAAFAVRHIDENTFFNGVKKFHNHWNCKIRGLCAENLTSHILNSSTAKRDALLKQFEKEIQYWLSREDDCWVFEHVFHLFSSLHKQGADTRWLFPARLSPLLKGAPNWYELGRSEFLRHIEARKEELVQPSFFARFTRRLSPA